MLRELEMWKWIQENQILSGTGAFLLTGIVVIIKHVFTKKKNNDDGNILEKDKAKKKDKEQFKILFIDDQSFKVVDILKKQGWINTKRIKDVRSFEDPDVVEADVYFVDIQGVGKIMEFKDEGLGLAIALKEKFPNKKLVIYSSENKGDRFHKALKKADEQLPKNADPYELQQIIENFFDKQ